MARSSESLLRVLLMVLPMAATSCYDPEFFGPDTEVGQAVRRGTVTSASDGSPIAGARVYWAYFGFIVGNGAVLVPDTAVSDAAGNYRLETQYYCNSQLAARADGFVSRQSSLSYLACPDTQPEVVDIVLEPEP